MCGLAGAVDLRAATSGEQLEAVSRAMAAALAHRGPDDHGAWVDAAAGVALAHQRLSILDLSAGGHQPMVSQDGRWVLVYNGEIYNYRELRTRLESEGCRLRSQSDTEVLIEALARWGVAEALERSNGMWALAAFDRRDRRLVFAVDRMGEKPLYVGWDDRWLWFGSELKAIVAHPHAKLEPSRDALSAYMRYGCVPAPHSIYQSVWKLPAGSMLEFSLEHPPTWQPTRWWRLDEVACEGVSGRRRHADRDIVPELEAALVDSVRLRMVADVPVGAFLSGGVDSSLVVALMAEQASDVRTFSIAFEESAYNEAPHAAAVASFLGTRHTELAVTPGETLDIVPSLPNVYDEPFADSSQIPTSILAALTRSHVTVALSGDGGDEFFSGYERYLFQRRLAPWLQRIPQPVRRAAAGAILSISPEGWDRAGRAVSRMARSRQDRPRIGDRVHKGAALLTVRDVAMSYRRLMSAWDDPGQLVIGGDEPATALTDPSRWPRGMDLDEQLRLVDQLVYLPDDLLTKVDRAAMAASLETRIPLLDPRVIRLAWSAPSSVHRSDGRGKFLLRSLLDRRVPTAMTNRPKMGFGVPVGSWLRGPLRPWAESLLDASRMRQDDFLNVPLVSSMWAEHLSGRRDWTARLWAVLMWQAWYDRWCRS